MIQNLYLSEDEHKALVLLSQRYNSYDIRKQCVLPAAGMSVFMSEIRRKTGISDTRQTALCAEYLRKYAAAINGKGPSPVQFRLLQWLNEGMTLPNAAAQSGISPAEALRSLPAAWHALAIFTNDPRAQRVQFRLYCAAFRPPSVKLTPFQMEVLTLMAEGRSALQIAQHTTEPLPYVQLKMREVAARTGCSAKGRDVQRNLLRVYLAHHCVQPVTMDDPAF